MHEIHRVLDGAVPRCYTRAMLRKILVVIAVLVVLLLGLVAMQPNTFAVTRSAVVSAPPAIAFAQVNDFHRWAAWSPWAQLDPSMKTTFSGAPAGEGAIYDWTGNDKVGRGRMTILVSRPGEAIDLRLEFIEPFPSTALTQFTFAPESAGTKVTWKMSGDNGFMGKAFGLV